MAAETVEMRYLNRILGMGQLKKQAGFLGSRSLILPSASKEEKFDDFQLQKKPLCLSSSAIAAGTVQIRYRILGMAQLKEQVGFLVSRSLVLSSAPLKVNGAIR